MTQDTSSAPPVSSPVSAPPAPLVRAFDDLDRVGRRLDDFVATAASGSGAPDRLLDLPTPAQGWTVGHQLAHLAWTDEVTSVSVTRPEEFGALVEQAMADPLGLVDAEAQRVLDESAGSSDHLLDRWRRARAALLGALRATDPSVQHPWFGPPMRAATLATARIMETWAHGTDVTDALATAGIDTGGAAEAGTRPGFDAPEALPHVAKLGYRTRGFAFAMNELPVPAEEVRVELAAADGTQVAFGSDDAPERVSGPLIDFCLLVTQRVHLDDTALQAEGAGAQRWLEIAQCFAGLPGGGRTATGSGPSDRAGSVS